ncbi:30S ribosomal protein S18 [Haliangium ochraceum]|uniref:Small ribosomal subunit protein bS18 n=1 Tax=Haliangium ochraceum (strain DSM 14365 / JCM 11303 / SMP-2) TaxID=502025 RepID=D0LPW1_HALO1|nr:ribosomal protein S18 [Haliangium ochraceum DSM 14365]
MADTTDNSNGTEGTEPKKIVRPMIRMLGKSPARSMSRRKVCRFCLDNTVTLDYKNAQLLKNFITDRGKITPRRISGNCAKHQRALALAIRRARMIALLPFAVTGR